MGSTAVQQRRGPRHEPSGPVPPSCGESLGRPHTSSRARGSCRSAVPGPRAKRGPRRPAAPSPPRRPPGARPPRAAARTGAATVGIPHPPVPAAASRDRPPGRPEPARPVLARPALPARGLPSSPGPPRRPSDGPRSPRVSAVGVRQEWTPRSTSAGSRGWGSTGTRQVWRGGPGWGQGGAGVGPNGQGGPGWAGPGAGLNPKLTWGVIWCTKINS